MSRAGDEVAELLKNVNRRAIPHGLELVGTYEGRGCRVDLLPGGCTVSLDFNHPVLPEEVRIEETSLYGPQLQEAWESGEAVQTGDLEFDLAFIVLAAKLGESVDQSSAKRMNPALRGILLKHRDRLRDADISARSIKLSGTWTLQRGPRQPSIGDVKELLNRGVDFARAVGA